MLVSLSFFLLSLSALVSALPGSNGRAVRRSPSILEHPTLGPLNTNAKRLAAGLSPLPVNRAWTPSKVEAAKRTNPSSTSFSGAIQVTRDGSLVGYIGKDLSGSGDYVVVPSGDIAGFSFSANPTGTTPSISITDTTATDFSRSFTPSIGGAINHNANLSSSSSDFAVLAGTVTTPAGSDPQTTSYTTAAGDDVASAIWAFDPSSSGLTVIWTNYGGQSTPTTLFWNPQGSSIVATGNPTEYAQDNSSAYPIALTLVAI